MNDLVQTLARCDTCGNQGEFWMQLGVVNHCIACLGRGILHPELPDGWTRRPLAIHGRVDAQKPHLQLHVKLGKFSGLPLWTVARVTDNPTPLTQWHPTSAQAIAAAQRF